MLSQLLTTQTLLSRVPDKPIIFVQRDASPLVRSSFFCTVVPLPHLLRPLKRNGQDIIVEYVAARLSDVTVAVGFRS